MEKACSLVPNKRASVPGGTRKRLCVVDHEGHAEIRRQAQCVERESKICNVFSGPRVLILYFAKLRSQPDCLGRKEKGSCERKDPILSGMP